MGDRANVAILGAYDDQNPVFLYTHWEGYELPEVVREALKGRAGRARWNHGLYLARIVFDQMIGDRHGSEAGFGISTSPAGDIEYDIIVLDAQNGKLLRVARSAVAGIPHGNWREVLKVSPSIGFDAYIAVKRTWDNLTDADGVEVVSADEG